MQCTPQNQIMFAAISNRRSYDDPTLTPQEQQQARKYALNIVEFRDDMVASLHALLESPLIPGAMKSAIALNLSRLIYFPK